MRNPLVTIITPCYNSEKYLDRFLNSIKHQTYNNLQLILVDDGSTDNTKNIIMKFKKNNKNIIVDYCYQKNKGVGGAINTGLKLIRGDFFCWCDSDNFYDNNYVEENVQIFLNTKSNIVRCDGYFVTENEILKPFKLFSDGNNDIYNKNLFMNSIIERNFHFGCCMVRTSAFDEVCPSRNIYESREGQNWQIFLPLAYCYECYYINKPLFYFVVRANSVSHSLSSDKNKFRKQIKQQKEHEKILNYTINSIKPLLNSELYLDVIKKKYLIRKIIYSKANKKGFYFNYYKIKLKLFYYNISKKRYLSDSIYAKQALDYLNEDISTYYNKNFVA